MIGRILRAPLLVGWVLWNVLVSAIHIARMSLRPGPVDTPCLIRYAMRSRTDLEVTVLAWAITVTPGTLTVAIGDTDMWVHIVRGGPREEMTTMLAEVEDRVLAVLRGPEAER